jgi:hypothetical protein
MKKMPSDPADAAALRRRAEEKLQGKQKGKTHRPLIVAHELGENRLM